MDYIDEPEVDSTLTKSETVAIGIVVVAGVAAITYKIGYKIKAWREERRLDKIQEEYNKIWDEYKYYQGEESAE